MHLLFAHDHVFYRGPAGEVWASAALRRSIWGRYLGEFSALTVAARDGGTVEAMPEEARSDRAEVRFALLPNINGPLRSLRRPRVARAVRRLVGRCDAVVARLPSEIGLLACAAARELGKPLMVEVVGSPLDAYRVHQSPVARLYAPIAHARMRGAVAKAQYAVYVTRRWLQGQYPSPNPHFAFPVAGGAASYERLQAGFSDVEVSLPGADVRGTRARRLAELARGRQPVFGTIATLAGRYKGLQVAIPAFAALKREGRPFCYRILGGGPTEHWRRLIEENGLSGVVRLDGFRSADELLRWLDEIDVYIQPSFQEGLPRAVVEAMSSGVPCIGSDAGGIPELIDPGFVHRAGDVSGLAEHLRRAMDDPAALARLSEHSFATVMKFDPAQLEAQRKAVMRAFAEQARGRR